MGSMISIIVPVYKIEKYLDRCIQSIVDQTYSNLEIILVDDGSPDRCPQICDEWSLRDRRIKVIHQENKGVSAARNAGIQVAQGELLYFVDGDDWIDLALCEKAVLAFAEHDADIVVFDCNKITEAGTILGNTEKLTEGILSTEDSLKALFQGHMNSYVWNKVFKRTVFQGITFPNRTAFEDLAIVYKLFMNTSRIYCLNEQLYYYLQRTDSATAVIGPKKLGELFLSRWESYKNLKELYPDVAEIALQRAAWSAILLHDCSLWEQVNEEIYVSAMAFLREHKERINRTEHSLVYWLFFTVPGVYNLMRRTKHALGGFVRTLRRKNNV